MHMSDALISPIVGGTMIASSAGALAYSTKTIKSEMLEKRMPLMSVMGAFLFAAQMINFAIPGTGSSGHIGGGILLAILLGSESGFITMACVLLIQALFFADGGLLAFGCNLINLGFMTCYIAYPLFYKPIISKGITKKRIYIATILATVVGLQLGSLGVVVETVLSGKIELTFLTFLSFMQPIHLIIGLIEGVITATIISFLYENREDILYDVWIKKEENKGKEEKNKISILKISIWLLIITVLLGSGFALFSSGRPDGLEWSLEKVTNMETVKDNDTVQIQEELALLPNYEFKDESSSSQLGRSTSGLFGSVLTLVFALIIGFIVRAIRKRKAG